MAEWGYCKHNGPDTWAANFPAARGLRQSPINIKSTECLTSSDNLQSSPLSYEYGSRPNIIANTGASWKVGFNGSDSLLEGGPLADQYKIEQFHCHWGRNEQEGSEHTVDGKSFPAEIHFVHWNCSKYGSFAEAVDKPDGLCVLGVMFEVGLEEHSELQKLVSLMSRIEFKGDSCTINDDIDPANFLPDNKSYWTYLGSLTTPPCLESVTWILFKNPIQISANQLRSFRNLKSYARDESRPNDEFGGNIMVNYRPPLDACGRSIMSCDC